MINEINILHEIAAGLLYVVSYHQNIHGTINGDSRILADFFCKTSRQFTPGIELSSADQVWQILLTLNVGRKLRKIHATDSEIVVNRLVPRLFACSFVPNSVANIAINQQITV